MGYYRRRYRRRSYGRRNNDFAGVVFLFTIGVIYALFAAFKYVIQHSFILFVIVVVIIGWFVHLFIERRKRASLEHLTPGINPEINAERHTTREYFIASNEGEETVARILANELDFREYYVLNNITIPSSYNGSSQIDHIVISKYGIFVVETKDYKGWIFGSADHDNWTQSLPGGRSKFQFQNPLRQNWAHIQALKEIFPSVPEDKFKSVVVFVGSSEFKTPMPENVTNPTGMVAYIRKHTEPIVPEELRYLVLGKLTFRAQTNPISASDHLANLDNHHPENLLKR